MQNGRVAAHAFSELGVGCEAVLSGNRTLFSGASSTASGASERKRTAAEQSSGGDDQGVGRALPVTPDRVCWLPLL